MAKRLSLAKIRKIEVSHTGEVLFYFNNDEKGYLLDDIELEEYYDHMLLDLQEIDDCINTFNDLV